MDWSWADVCTSSFVIHASLIVRLLDVHSSPHVPSYSTHPFTRPILAYCSSCSRPLFKMLTFKHLISTLVVVRVAITSDASPIRHFAYPHKRVGAGHHVAALARRSESVKRDACDFGAWQCAGDVLQRCYSGAWNDVQTCSTGTICAVDGGSVGCVWVGEASATAGRAASGTTVFPSNTASTSTNNGGGGFFGQAPKSASNDSSAPSLSESSSSTSSWQTTIHAVSTTSSWHAATSTATSTATSSSSAKSSATSTPSSGSSSGASAQRYVIYSDRWLSAPPPATDLAPYTHFLLSFWLSSGAADNALMWEGLGSDKQQQVKAEYNAAGIKLMVSAFGSTDWPTSNGHDPAQTAQKLADWVKANNLDGVDIDYEDNTAFNGGTAEQWVITFQKELRSQLGSSYLISHAPQAPWFTTSGSYTGGGYSHIHSAVGSGIDFYNVQFYNQGHGAYTDCDGLLFQSTSTWPGTSVFEINSSGGVPLDKIVIGKPINSGAASNGYTDPSTLGGCVSQAQSKGWNAGVMFWEYDSSAVGVIRAVIG